MRALVTGAAGFIGSNLVDRLLADGHQVIGLDNLSTGHAENLDAAQRGYGHCSVGKFTFIRGDVTAQEFSGIVAATSPHVVFHLAAQADLQKSVTDPLYDARVNVLGTINVLEACRRADVPRVVYAASGGSRYGAPTLIPVSEQVSINPLSPYAAAKIAGELYAGVYAEMYGLSTVCLGLANVFGPRQDPDGEAGVIAIFCKALIEGSVPTVYGDGESTRDYVYVGDVVDAFVRAAAADSTVTGIVNVGTGLQTSVTKVHRLIAAAVGGAPPPRHAPARTGEVRAIALDNTRCRAELGWAPTVSIADGIKRTIHWLRSTSGPQAESLKAM
ncbi:NAD-dependent epimerase/dehydratase family protein [Mycolicibacterium elephantis]|nr:NAD-dependent epimerase/dehydratase family protein [Mycolicibacterium elephantis]MCV7219558.1 GDP-mannose 4,6-dehydratase [Mycolicibacterium elephantis]